MPLLFKFTVRFCERYVPAGSRTRDQMVQAARSGVQNIAEGSAASGTSKKTELKLTSVARASLEELRLDYEDFLRQRNLPKWPAADPRRASLVVRRCRNGDEVADWVRGVRDDALRAERHGACSNAAAPGYPEIAANAALTLIGVASTLLDRQLAALAQAFAEEGGFTERLYRVRTAQKRKGKMD